jgi:hypothetical protein
MARDGNDPKQRTQVAPAAVVSCHVERPLDDAVWRRFLRMFEARPGGFEVMALMRPPTEAERPREDTWVERAQRVAADQLLGHHTHFGDADIARPLDPTLAADQLRRERRWLAQHGLQPRFFCGGGWFMDPPVATAVAEAGYVDCTALSSGPSYFTSTMPHVSATEPSVLILDDGQRLAELPVTHSLGNACRCLLRPRRVLPSWLHIYFHDWELLDVRRAASLRAVLAVLGRRYRPFALNKLDPAATAGWPELTARDVMRP